MIKKAVALIKYLFKKPDTFGVSFDNKIKLNKLPTGISKEFISFYEVNNDLNRFELLESEIDNKKETVRLTELSTGNEIILSFDAFTLLFTEVKVPVEAKL